MKKKVPKSLGSAGLWLIGHSFPERDLMDKELFAELQVCV